MDTVTVTEPVAVADKKAARGKSFGSGFNPGRYRPTKRTELAPQEEAAAFTRHADCGGLFKQSDGRYSVYVQCDKCGGFIDPNKSTDSYTEDGILYTRQDEMAAPVVVTGAKAKPVFGVKPVPVSSGDTDALATIRALLGGAVDEAQVRKVAAEVVADSFGSIAEAVREAFDKSGALRKVIEIRQQDGPVVTLEEHTHTSFESVLKTAGYRRPLPGTDRTTRFNIMLVGPKGCGKTHLAHQVAKALGLRYGALSCGAGTTDGEIIGRVIPNLTGGTANLQTSLFLDFFEHGGVFLLDELDALNPTTALRLNMALENGRMFDALGREVQRHADFLVLAGLNTWGHGASREYCGREMQDSALLDRFAGAEFDFGYDEKLEAFLCPDAGLLAKLWGMRKRAVELKMVRRIVSTRRIVAAYELVAGMGMTHKEAIDRVTAGWPEADKTAVLR